MASQPARRYATPGDLLRDLLMVARGLGAGAVPIDGQVWLTATRFKPPFWQSNFGWVATTCALCLMVSIVQLAPDFARKATRRTSDATGHVSATPELPTSATEGAPTDPRVRDVDQTRTDTSKPAKQPDDPERSVVGDSKFFGPLKPAVPNPDATAFKPLERTEDFVPAPLIPELRPSSAAPDSISQIQIVNGKSYPSVEAACAEASDSGNVTVIELSYDGLREPERPIRLSNKKVVIRASEGFRPTIRFSVADATVDTNHPQMITIAGGSLDLVNVDLVMTVPNQVGSERWTMFSLERPEKVQLQGCTLTVQNPQGKSACVFEQRTSVGQGLESIGIRNDGMPVVPPELLLTETLVRGNADFIVMRDPVPARYELKDSAVGIDGNLLQLNLVMDSKGMERESITLELEHFTFRSGQSLLSVEGSGGQTEKLPPIIVYARNNVIACGANKPLISMRGLTDFMDFTKSFSWRGNFNFYDNVDTFLDISTIQTTNSRKMDHNAWKGLTSEGVGSSNAQVNWRTKTVDRTYANATSKSFELVNDQPATRGGSDGYSVGAPLKKLHPQDK